MRRLKTRILILALLCSASLWSISDAAAAQWLCSDNADACYTVGYHGCCPGSCYCIGEAEYTICVCMCCLPV
jgi:hypothetical protein